MDLRVRLATHRKSARKFFFCNLGRLGSTCESVWPGLYDLKFSLNADTPTAPSSVEMKFKQGKINAVVEWKQPPPGQGEGSISSYLIKYHAVTSPNSVTSVSIPSEQTTYKFVNLTRNTAYSMEIAAVSNVGEGLWSTLEFTTNSARKL